MSVFFLFSVFFTGPELVSFFLASFFQSHGCGFCLDSQLLNSGSSVVFVPRSVQPRPREVGESEDSGEPVAVARQEHRRKGQNMGHS